MCSSTLRRLSSLRTVKSMEYPDTVDLHFELLNQASMDSLLTSLRSNSGAFKSVIGLTSGEVTMTSFEFTQGGNPSDPLPPSVRGTIGTLIELSVADRVVTPLRRLLETLHTRAAAEILNQAVVDSLNQLIVPELPSGSSVSSEIVENSAPDSLTANVTFSVPSDISLSQSRIFSFLSSDAAGSRTLPSMISAKSALDVGYSPGYVPIVWSRAGDKDASAVVNILPYIFAGLGVIVVTITVVLYKYRFVLSSWWDDLFRDRSSRWGFGIIGGTDMAPERGKSELSSTPDTATNLDADEFDELYLRSPTRQSI